jgi:hypothetical protein
MGNYSAVAGRTQINADKTQINAVFYKKSAKISGKSASSAFLLIPAE